MQTQEHQGFMRLGQVLKLLGVGRSTWYALVKQGKAPAPRAPKDAPGTKLYKRAEIMALAECWDKQMGAAA
jgi:predicted site-specific integrase-resolvase